ncbi:MAG: CDP-alcohol phosphatidyltransferase family protein [Spirochaetes bacterium]|nr:CDP-alcohol phosphatidyltransferase family protein [Spirochaetota bacterium]
MPLDKKIFNISNILTISRVLILPFVVIVLKKNTYQYNFIFLGILLFMILTDFLDGYFARKFDLTSSLGKILDPVSDKIIIIVITFLITKYRNFPLWAFYIMAGRELVILLGAVVIFRKRKILVTSNIIGKFSVFLITLSILGYIFLDARYNPLPFILLIIGIIIYLISFVSYTVRYLVMMSYTPRLEKYKIFTDSRFF